LHFALSHRLDRQLARFGARRPEELPYFGPLQKVPDKLLGKYFCYSRVPNEPRVYVQDRIRDEARQIAQLLGDSKTHVYICGLNGMEGGVDEAFADACRAASLDWTALKPAMRESGRYHVETY
jgi:benzoyl-CoA 2,3-dioxygenase component A